MNTETHALETLTLASLRFPLSAGFANAIRAPKHRVLKFCFAISTELQQNMYIFVRTLYIYLHTDSFRRHSIRFHLFDCDSMRVRKLNCLFAYGIFSICSKLLQFGFQPNKKRKIELAFTWYTSPMLCLHINSCLAFLVSTYVLLIKSGFLRFNIQIAKCSREIHTHTFDRRQHFSSLTDEHAKNCTYHIKNGRSQTIFR